MNYLTLRWVLSHEPIGCPNYRDIFFSSLVRGHRRSGSHGNSPIVTSSSELIGTVSANSSPAKSLHRSVTEPAHLEESKGSAWEPGAPIDLSVLNLGKSFFTVNYDTYLYIGVYNANT